MSDTILSLTQAQLAYGHHPLLDQADFTLQAGERVGLIGRNGAGKSSLLHVLAGDTPLDDGQRHQAGGLRIAYVAQEPVLPEGQAVGAYLLEGMVAAEDWARSARAGALMDALGLTADQSLDGLSGGLRKRVALAHAMASDPDLLLLDEPTNHLDLDGILWLEQWLQTSAITLVVVTHDRRFLDTVATRIVELDRGQLLSFPGRFSAWQAHKLQWLQSEALAQARFDKLLSQEEAWIRKGIEARRTRNEGRVRRLEALRRERAARRDAPGQVRFTLDQGGRSGRRVIEMEHVSFQYPGHPPVVRDFSCLIQRGDRIGLIGPNGAGKTTLLRLMLGELTPQSGRVRHGTQSSIGYFDQLRSQLDPTLTVAQTIRPGSDWIEIGGVRKHVMRYLEDFLFPPARARSPVASLSGGERARLALARLFTQSHNVLVLDEPTNDLDIDTLELLETLLQDYPGTVLLVSHDRSFLDAVVTQLIVSEGDGHWRECIGGYADWEAEQARAAAKRREAPKAAESTPPPAVEPAAPAEAPAPVRARSRIAPWEREELAALPDQITALEAKQAALAEQLSDPALYQEGDATAAQALQAQLEALAEALETHYARWAELEDKAKGSAE